MGPALTPSAQISLANASRLVGSWRGTWRNTRGASGPLTVFMAQSTTLDRLIGTVQFSGGSCPRVASLEGGPVADTLVLTADLGPPCGVVTLTFIESRSEEPRLTGSFKTEYPENGLFAVYPR